MRGSFRAAVAMLAGVGGLALAAPALAATNQPIAQTGGAEATFTIAGVPLTVNVALDTTTGDITSVSVDPNTGLTATADSPTKVKFETADGTTKVSVKAKKNSLSMGVRTAALKDLVGSNAWTGDLFGTGTKTVVKYTIGDDGSGAPTFAFDGDAAPLPADTTATVLGTWNGSHGDDDDDDTSAGGRMAFDFDGFRKTLSISVHVDRADDGGGHASLRVTLQGKDIQRKPLADLAGAKTWKGQLCDGSAGVIEYTVTPEGSVTVQSTTPAADVKSSNRGVLVKFSTGDKVSIKLSVPSSGNASLKIDRKGKSCSTTRVTAPDPSVNTPVSTTVSSERNRGDKSGKGDDGGRNRNRGGNGGGGDRSDD